MKAIIIDNEKVIPSKIICVGRNYVEHIRELNNEIPTEIIFFMKPNSSINNQIIFPKACKACSYEAEISFVIHNNKILAVGFGLDLTLREVQSQLKQKGLPWERAKAFDNSAVFSNFVRIDNIENLVLELEINTLLVQRGSIDCMIHKPYDIMKNALSFTSFENGDILMTGTPRGVGNFNIGDIFVGRILNGEAVIIEKKFIVQDNMK